MIRTLRMTGVALAASVLVATPSLAAVVVHTSPFITNPVYFNGFEALTDDYLATPVHSEGGIRVEEILTHPSSYSEIYTASGAEGLRGFYVNGNFGYTKITRSDGSEFDSIQFLASSNWCCDSQALFPIQYRLLRAGGLVGSGELMVPDLQRFTTIGFSGEMFDELWLQVSDEFDGKFDPAYLDLGFYDSFAIGQRSGGAIPEPRTWTLLILGFGVAGQGLRRLNARRRWGRVA